MKLVDVGLDRCGLTGDQRDVLGRLLSRGEPLRVEELAGHLRCERVRVLAALLVLEEYQRQREAADWWRMSRRQHERYRLWGYPHGYLDRARRDRGGEK